MLPLRACLAAYDDIKEYVYNLSDKTLIRESPGYLFDQNIGNAVAFLENWISPQGINKLHIFSVMGRPPTWLSVA